ncbi:hypothetical protein Tco_0723247, partial [Tanacetum coccineum]
MQFLNSGLNTCSTLLEASFNLRETLPDVKDTMPIIFLEKTLIEASPSSFFGFLCPTSGPNPNLHCTNCEKVSHTVDRCFDIIGYPPGYNKNTGPKSNGPKTFNANSVSSSSEKGSSLPFTNDQMIKLMNLYEAHSGNIQANMAGRVPMMMREFFKHPMMKAVLNLALALLKTVSSQGLPDLRRSSRTVRQPARLNDYVVNSSEKYGLENMSLILDLTEDVYMTLPPGYYNDKSKVLMQSKSSAKAEYRSMASATCEIAANPVFHEKSKHFEIDVHLVREKVTKCVTLLDGMPRNNGTVFLQKIVIGEERLRVYVAFDRGHNGNGRMDAHRMKQDTNKSHGNVTGNATTVGRMHNWDACSFAEVLNVVSNRKEGFNKEKGVGGGETHLNNSGTGTYGTRTQYENKYKDEGHMGNQGSQGNRRTINIDEKI